MNDSKQNPEEKAAKGESRGRPRESGEAPSKSSVYGGRERYVSLEHELGKRRHSSSGSSSRRSSHRHHRRQQRSHRVPLGVKFLWAGLMLIVVAYLGLLGYSHYKVRKPADQTSTKTVAQKKIPEDSQERVRTTGDKAGRVISGNSTKLHGRITDWKNASGKLEAAQSLYKKGSVDRAIERLRAALTVTPDHIDTKLMLAGIYVEAEQSELARGLLIEVLDADPLNADARLLLASLLSAAGEHDSALELAKWILETESYSLEAHRVAAAAYLHTDRTRAALPHLQKLTSLQRDNIVAMNHLAKAYSQLREFGKAIKVFNDILTRDADNSITYYNLAVCYAQQDLPAPAVDVLRRAVEKFGAGFVSTWIQSKDFDRIRSAEGFAALEAEIQKAASPEETPAPSE